ncbi:FimV/HubP family polar landmark protein [Halomonas sp.]|uniref:FimV/HubP family polar landmark protein n=1 Tax=Halomonas sp. TaxID=1486246 RepID=UPI00356B1998
MKRKLTAAILLSLSAASPLALALGLGDTDVNSTLNAPLRASIPLTDAAGLQPDLLNVSVADERSFSAAGLTRTPLAASVRAVVQQRGGQLVIDLVTERPVREPWVDLLLRFDWPGGQQLREVTLLFDPPNYDQMPALIGAPRTATASVRAPPPPAPREQAPVQPVATPAASRQPEDLAWIRNGDTLWSVAGRLRPDSGLSMNQMMVSLVQANPEVFPSGNINAMRAGFTLVVPGRETIAQRSSAEADRIVQAMNQAWANRGSGAPARVAMGAPDNSAPGGAVATASSTLPADSGDSTSATDASDEADEATAPAESTTADATQDDEGPRLTLLTDAELAAEGGISAGESASLQAEGASQGTDDAGSGEIGRQRVVIDPEVLKALYGQTLYGQTLNGEGDLTSDERLMRLENRWMESQQALETVRSERDELETSLGEMRDELEAMRDQLAAMTAGGQGADAPGTGGVAMPSGQAENPPETPWWGALYQGALDRSLMLAGAGLAALLALWALLRFRRREDKYEYDGATFGQVRTVGMGVAGIVTPGRTGLSNADTFNEPVPIRASMPQAEAINEADIFIAYGRFDQARELLEASLEQDPERDDLRLKLLMVHLEQGDYEAADRQSSTLKAGGDSAVLAETERLMNRRLSARANPATSSADSGPAVFSASQEMPPRLFDEPGDEPGDGDDTMGVSSGESSPESTTSDTRDPRAPYRRPEDSMPEPEEADSVENQEPARLFEAPADVPLSSLASQEPQEPQEPVASSGLRSDADAWLSTEEDAPSVQPDTEESLSDQELPPLPPEPAPAMPELKARQADDGRDIIDYQPPALDPNPARREETPMQPSVDFTSSAADSKASQAEGDVEGSTGSRATGKGPMDAPDEWDVEEVVFPPLDVDNTAFSTAASSTATSSTDTLAEARRLLDSGESDRARGLLESLAGSGDPAIEEEVQALITRFDL